MVAILASSIRTKHQPLYSVQPRVSYFSQA